MAKAFRKSRKTIIPKSLQPGPVLGPGLALYHKAFWDLTADRSSPDAPIKWTATNTWALKYGLDSYAQESLFHHIRAMDLALLEWRVQKSKTKSKKGKEPSRGKP